MLLHVRKLCAPYLPLRGLRRTGSVKFCSNVANANFDGRNSGSAEADNDAVFDGTSDEVIHGSLLRGRHDVLRLRSKIIHRNAEGVRDLMRTREVFGFERDVAWNPWIFTP